MEYSFNFGKLFLHNNDYISKCLIEDKNWESYHDLIIDKYINSESIVLDIGANIGIFTIKCASKCKYIYSYEPYIENYNLLIKNIHVNNYNNIIPNLFGIGDKLDITKINWITPNNFGAIGLDISLDKNSDYCKYISSITDNKNKQTVLINTLDNLNFDKVDFIKIDTEGCELLCIKGGINLIKKNKPILLIEHNSEQQINNMIQYLHNNDLFYNIKHLSKHDYLYTL